MYTERRRWDRKRAVKTLLGMMGSIIITESASQISTVVFKRRGCEQVRALSFNRVTDCSQGSLSNKVFTPAYFGK